MFWHRFPTTFVRQIFRVIIEHPFVPCVVGSCSFPAAHEPCDAPRLTSATWEKYVRLIRDTVGCWQDASRPAIDILFPLCLCILFLSQEKLLTPLLANSERWERKMLLCGSKKRQKKHSRLAKYLCWNFNEILNRNEWNHSLEYRIKCIVAVGDSVCERTFAELGLKKTIENVLSCCPPLATKLRSFRSSLLPDEGLSGRERKSKNLTSYFHKEYSFWFYSQSHSLLFICYVQYGPGIEYRIANRFPFRHEKVNQIFCNVYFSTIGLGNNTLCF